MNFSLNSILIDEIQKALENQEKEFFLDAETGALVEEDAVNEEYSERYFELPAWDSADGFKLREEFVDHINVPAAKAELQSVLHSGRGVFKNFRNVLKKYPEVEKRWFLFKNRKMTVYINEWYNGLREIWGLEKLDYISEVDDSLLHDDFTFLEYDSLVNKEEVLSNLNDYFRNEKQLFPDDLGMPFYEMWRTQFENFEKSGQSGFICRSLSDDFAGCITASDFTTNQEMLLLVTSLFVPENFRGLGIGTELIDMLLTSIKENGKKWILFPAEITPDILEPLLLRLGFEKIMAGYVAKLHD